LPLHRNVLDFLGEQKGTMWLISTFCGWHNMPDEPQFLGDSSSPFTIESYNIADYLASSTLVGLDVMFARRTPHAAIVIETICKQQTPKLQNNITARE
jgi:hypothetical protein